MSSAGFRCGMETSGYRGGTRVNRWRLPPEPRFVPRPRYKIASSLEVNVPSAYTTREHSPHRRCDANRRTPIQTRFGPVALIAPLPRAVVVVLGARFNAKRLPQRIEHRSHRGRNVYRSIIDDDLG